MTFFFFSLQLSGTEQVRLCKSRRGAGAGDRRQHAESRPPPPLYRRVLPGSSNGSVPSYKFWFYTSGPDLYRIGRTTKRAAGRDLRLNRINRPDF